jgi:hypothetical protein
MKLHWEVKPLGDGLSSFAGSLKGAAIERMEGAMLGQAFCNSFGLGMTQRSKWSVSMSVE